MVRFSTSLFSRIQLALLLMFVSVFGHAVTIDAPFYVSEGSAFDIRWSGATDSALYQKLNGEWNQLSPRDSETTFTVSDLAAGVHEFKVDYCSFIVIPINMTLIPFCSSSAVVEVRVVKGQLSSPDPVCYLPGPTWSDRCSNTITRESTGARVACVWNQSTQQPVNCGSQDSFTFEFDSTMAAGTTLVLKAHEALPANNGDTINQGVYLDSIDLLAKPRPAPPGAVTGSHISNSRVMFTWGVSATTDIYYSYQMTGAASASGLTTSRSFTYPNSYAGAAYSFAVKACYKANLNSCSDYVRGGIPFLTFLPQAVLVFRPQQ